MPATAAVKIDRAEINRANAQHSTGPRTEEGKAKSSRNRLSSGFASNTRFIDGENAEEFDVLLADFMNEHLPSTLTEQVLVEKMAHHQWITLRALRLQAEELQKFQDNRSEGSLALLIRYQTASERSFYRALNELQKLRKHASKPEIGFESKFPVDAADIQDEFVAAIDAGAEKNAEQTKNSAPMAKMPRHWTTPEQIDAEAAVLMAMAKAELNKKRT